ncbi:hypothetical protein HPP92_023777 [Vanilla planifolia]|uniref:Uncharacterized protein n=1 Tax=Vanilla planifolia TaxID=51239 RepID=A0A835PMD1_VANPL|nr:hypothetical protein HPP92_023777 [Vanilla planifolia]
MEIRSLVGRRRLDPAEQRPPRSVADVKYWFLLLTWPGYGACHADGGRVMIRHLALTANSFGGPPVNGSGQWCCEISHGARLSYRQGIRRDLGCAHGIYQCLS